MDAAALTGGAVIGGRYRLEEKIGGGGMGSLWRARHCELDVDVAVKLMSRDLLGNAVGEERFRREARAAARLKSPHVVAIFDYGVHEGQPYITMELLEGQDLEQLLARQGRQPVDRVAALVAQIAKGLRVAHEAGVVHRDLKPANVFLARVAGDEIAKVLDFGIAKRTGAEAAAVQADTSTGVLLGSPFYMSPEQARGLAVDARSDLWSLGVVAYQLLTGARPFAGAALGDLLFKICGEDPVPASRVVPELGGDVDAFFRRALARARGERFQSAAEMARALQEVASAAAPGRRAGARDPGPAAREVFAGGARGDALLGRLDETLDAAGTAPAAARSRAAARPGTRRAAVVVVVVVGAGLALAGGVTALAPRGRAAATNSAVSSVVAPARVPEVPSPPLPAPVSARAPAAAEVAAVAGVERGRAPAAAAARGAPEPARGLASERRRRAARAARAQAPGSESAVAHAGGAPSAGDEDTPTIHPLFGVPVTRAGAAR